MRKRILFSCCCILLMICHLSLRAQLDPPNDVNATPPSANVIAAGKWASTPVNLYTGMPSISIPVYHYSHHNGLSLNISLDYFSGGVRVNEPPTTVGLNWNLNAGGAITRTVRGLPDDIYPGGYMYTDTLPGDPTVNAHQFYNDTLDAEMDVFQYNFNGRSGEFFMGKNKQVFFSPLCKMKVKCDTSTGFWGNIIRFYVTAEDGTKYLFNDPEYASPLTNPYAPYAEPFRYGNAWYLSQIIAPLSPDTIKFNYNTTNDTLPIVFPRSVYVKNSNGDYSQQYTLTGTQLVTVKKLASIVFPDKKTITFKYNPLLKYDGHDSLLDKINIGDSIFRYGYSLDWNCCSGDTLPYQRSYLSGLRYYTATAMRPQYKFAYKGRTFVPYGTTDSTIYKKDYWGFFNGAYNPLTPVPSVTGVYTGANRNPSPDSVLASSLSSVTDPSGGITYYKFEANDMPQFTTTPTSVYLSNALTNTQTSITLNRALDNLYTFGIQYDLFYGRNGTLTGACPFTCSVTSLDGTITYGSVTTTLYKVASGVYFSFNAPSGTYHLNTIISSCSCSLGTLPIDVDWQNQTGTGTNMTSGGIRLKQLSHYDPVTGRTDTVSTYKYVTNGTNSSGFLGAMPVFSYPYQQTVINGTTVTTNYTVISSDPINDLNFTQGSPVGYSRVEVIRGDSAHNMGKTVYEFTNLVDANASLNSPSFPYAPSPQKDWAMGLPKRVSVYDSTGRLIDVTVNTYLDSLVIDSSKYFLSRKLAKVSTTYHGDPTLTSTPHTEYYSNADYYPQGGLAFLVKSVDSLYHSDTSLQVTEKDVQYDTNFNAIKITSPYDQTRGLSLEKRLYYPYNYTLSGAIGKLRDSAIITPVISTENWITGDATPRMAGAEITDFSQLTKGQIRPLTMYTLQSNAPVPQTTIGSFSAGALVRNTSYLLPQRNFVTYDTTANLLESKNTLSSQSNSVIMDYFGQFVVARVSNATQSDIAYSSFESDGSGNWTISSHARNRTQALTGKYSYTLDSGNITKSGLNSSLTYIVSYWSYTGASVTVSGAANQLIPAQQNNWSLHTQTISSVTSVTISGTGLIDELRLYPKDANMATFTYEPMIGISSTCDANNGVSYYSYDNLNRLKWIRDKDLNVIRRLDYADTTLPLPTAAFWKNTGTTRCETPLNGNVDHLSQDLSPFSSTFESMQWFFDHQDCATCPPPCSGEGYKLIGCSCQFGTRANVSCVKVIVNGLTKWRCTYMYCWTDGSGSGTYTVDNGSPCTVTGSCL